MQSKVDFINHIINTQYINGCTYLEIGVERPQLCFDKILASVKTSVDPNKITDDTVIDYLMESDTFFEKLENGDTEFEPDHKWDIIFIDGLHLAGQVYRDIQNSLRHCKGFILLHDCAPANFWNAHSDYEYFKENCHEWNGSTWKAFYKYRTETNKNTYTIAADYGVGVIEVNQAGAPIAFDNVWYEYGMFKQNMNTDLGLISVDEFVKRMNYMRKFT